MDTLLYTGVLIAIVLVLRRPVARQFGPRTAYALWALPALRLVLPPVVLPASMAPAEPELSGEAALALMVYAPGTQTAAPEPAFAASDLLLPLWLGGAALFLAWRIATYLRMRRELLAAARPVGEVGRIRLVETPAVESPVAFGVRHAVVALPPRFMAMEDRAARDLAIAHELEHHRGHDLLANFAAQALLALHWFNPLAWFGWRAMRRDQEAACDARVLEGCGQNVRAAYASVIASFAAGPRLALAAPMACPVLGEKSIIHRLRSLSMSDISPRRRLLGRLLLAGGAIAVPLTASVSYAAADVQTLEQVPLPPSAAAPPEAPEAPEAPAAPEALEAPEAPEAPAAPALSEREENVRIRRIVREGAEGDHPRIVRHVELRDEPFSEEQRAQFDAMAEEMEVLRKDMAARSGEMRAHALAMAEAGRNVPEVLERCDTDEPVSHSILPDGRKRIVICNRLIERQARDGLRQALAGLRQARGSVARNTAMSASVRSEVLGDLDKEIARLEAER
jgi:beta-lactamase regulating signal transducer with metallopeptidase domain